MQWGLSLLLDKMNDDNIRNGIPSASNKESNICSLCVLLREKKKNSENQWRKGRVASSLIYACSSFYA